MMKQGLASHNQSLGLERIKFLDTSMLRKVMGETRVTSEKALVAVAYLRMVKESGSAEQVYMMMEKCNLHHSE